MQSYHPTEQPPADLSNGLLHAASVVQGAEYLVAEESAQIVNEPTRFSSHFIDSMDMYADMRTVANYLDVHHEWFRRCAAPMTVEPIGKNSYALVVGQFGSFGYEVEPKIGLDLLPQQEGVYRIETVPLNDDTANYDVDFRAAMHLIELPSEEASGSIARTQVLPETITRVQWHLDLVVSIQFPRFIHALPKSLIQNTGDRVLKQVVRQVSTRLTHKVLDDFHQTHGLSIPKRSRHWFFRRAENETDSHTAGDGEG